MRQQGWDKHPDYRGKRLVVRHGWSKPRYRLAHRPDGYCVFFTDTGRCRIHEEFGEAAKPLVCRMFPYQLVPLENFAYLTIRRNCPSAALGRGRPLAEQEEAWRALVETQALAPQPTRPPPISRTYRGPWKDVFRITDALARLLCDAQFPLVRRLVHGLRFCDLMEDCRLGQLEARKLGELVAMLETAAVKLPDDVFRVRTPPSAAEALVFRRMSVEYLRLHPGFAVENTWAGRWRWALAALEIALARGQLPNLGPTFPRASFTALDRPLGHLPAQTLKPLNDYFEAMALSKRYAVRGRVPWPVIERFRALAASYAAAMWLVRWTALGRDPTEKDVVDAVIAIERGEGFGPLTGPSHRRRLAALGLGW